MSTSRIATPPLLDLTHLNLVLRLMLYCYDRKDPLPYGWATYHPEIARRYSWLGFWPQAFVHTESKQVYVMSSGTKFNNMFKMLSGLQLCLRMPYRLMSSHYAPTYFDDIIQKATQDQYSVVLAGHSAGAVHISEYCMHHPEIPGITLDSPGCARILKKLKPEQTTLDNVTEYLSPRNPFNSLDQHVGKQLILLHMEGHLPEEISELRETLEKSYWQSMETLGTQTGQQRYELGTISRATWYSITHNLLKILDLHTLEQWIKATECTQSSLKPISEEEWYRRFHGFTVFYQEYKHHLARDQAYGLLHRGIEYVAGILRCQDQIDWHEREKETQANVQETESIAASTETGSGSPAADRERRFSEALFSPHCG